MERGEPPNRRYFAYRYENLKMKPKQSKAREILWLVVSAMSLSSAVHKTIYVSLKDSWYFYLFTIIAFAMYLIRRNLRKKEE